MKVNWQDVELISEFSEQGVDCYRLHSDEFLNEYFIISEEQTRKLLNTPEIIGYGVYQSLVPSTAQMLYHLKEKKKITKANILAILRGALNYPLEECCHREHIRVHDISFLSSERIFEEDKIARLEIKYNKIATIDNSTMLIGDIIATGDTLVQCMKSVLDLYKARNMQLRNIVIFTVGGTRGIELLEEMTKEIRTYWPDFEGFILIYYEGVFTNYHDKGVSGINLKDVDFYWKNGIVAPEFRRQTLSMQNPLLEKCIIYDGGARRYEITEHIKEVLEYWEGMLERAHLIDIEDLLEEKLGYNLDISYEDWIDKNHYWKIDKYLNRWLYRQEKGYINGLKEMTVKEIAIQRIEEFSTELRKYNI